MMGNLKMSEWVSVDDRLPEFTGDFGGFALVSDDVIALLEDGTEVCADYSTEGWCSDDGDDSIKPTHWKPEPPKGVDNE
jgi:hypothetical protein